jgi:hypothetical protein
MYQIFRSTGHLLGVSDTPDYLVIDGRFFPTVAHPRGWSAYPEYELRSDGKIYRSANHPLGMGMSPDYEIGRDCRLYRTANHPEGDASGPEYELREIAG